MKKIISILMVLALYGCATTPQTEKQEKPSEPQQEASQEQEQTNLSCFSVRSVVLAEDMLVLDCANPSELGDFVAEISTDGPLSVTAILEIVSTKMRFNALPADRNGLIDTIKEANDLMQLKFEDKSMLVMVLDLQFDEQDSTRLLGVGTRFVTIKQDGIIEIDALDNVLDWVK